jgi:hypothetical protein
VLHIETTCKKNAKLHSPNTNVLTLRLLTIAQVCIFPPVGRGVYGYPISHGRVREPAEAANRPYLHPPSCVGDGALQTAGTARSAGVATRAAPSVHHQQAASPALESLPKIPVIISKRERMRRISFGFLATYRVGRSDMSWTARATKDQRTPGGKRACPRMAKRVCRRRPQNQRCKSGTSHDRSPPVAGLLPWR